MTTAKIQINARTTVLSRFSLLILWLMLIIIPVTAGRVIFSAAVDMERQLDYARIRQKLSIDLQKYEMALDPRTFLCTAFHQQPFQKILTGLYEGKDMTPDYRQHPFLRRLSDFSGPPAVEIENFSRLFNEFVGSRPDMVFVFAPEADDCSWSFKNPFSLQIDPAEFRSALKNSWNQLQERLNEKQKPSRKELPRRLRYLAEEKAISKALGLFDSMHSGYCIAREHFCQHNNSVIYISIFPIIDKNGSFSSRFVLAAVSAASLNPAFILKKTGQSFELPGITHSFGTTSHDRLPVFHDEGGTISLIGETPESFRKQAWKLRLKDNRRLAIRISASNMTAETAFKSSAANFILLLYALVATFVFTGIYTGKFSSFQSIHRLVAAGLFAGILLPVSGAIWLGVCYLNTQKQIEAENILDWMGNKIFAKDQAIRLQYSRNLLFRNIFSDIVAKMPAEKLKKINEVTRFFEVDCSEDLDIGVNENLEYRMFCYAFYHPELDDVVGKSNCKTKLTETMQPFFSSPAREVLHQLGALNDLPEEKVRQILQKSQIAMGLLDQVIDRKTVSKAFAEEQSAINNNLTTGREHLTAVFWKKPTGGTSGLSIFQTTSACWIHDYAKMLKAGQVGDEYIYNGYRINLQFYLTHPYSSRKLSTRSISITNYEDQRVIQYRQLAEAIFSLNDSIRINNLDSAQPHLLNASLGVGGEIFIMGTAVPDNSNTLLSEKTQIAIVSILAILCSMALARGLSRALLRPVPSFQLAINELNQQNYQWQLVIKNGDEFDQLAASFNHMTVKLNERQKISQLVSRNVLDAVSASDGQLLKPGGSRVEASILFADIRSFTTITEQNRPEEVVSMLNDYFSLMAEIIEKNGGLIDKLIGDAIQAVFYAHENKNCAESAVKSGLEMRAALAVFNRERSQQKRFTVDNGVGICTGSVICGRVGSEQGMLDATIIGSLVNQSARLESLSKNGRSSKVLIDKATSKALPPEYRRQQLQISETAAPLIELIQD